MTEETPLKSRLWPGGSLSKLQAHRSDYNIKDDMDVFSPLVDVQPITPSVGNWWDDSDAKKDTAPIDKKTSELPASLRRFPFTESNNDPHPISDWRSSTASKQVCYITTQTPFPLYFLGHYLLLREINIF